MNTSTVFPVGHYGGTITSGAPEEHLVRVARRLERLDDDEFGIWMLAHGLADVGPGNRYGDWTQADILERARDAEITEPDACLRRLLDRALLAAVPTGPDRVDDAVAFAVAYRMETLLVGLGAPPDQPDRHAIGVPGVGTAAVLDTGAYRLWQWGGVAPTLWRHCQDRIQSGAEGQDPLAAVVDPGKVLGDVLGELRVLLVHGCAYLDWANLDAVEGEAGVPR